MSGELATQTAMLANASMIQTCCVPRRWSELNCIPTDGASDTRKRHSGIAVGTTRPARAFEISDSNNAGHRRH
jgi:hypothetical protein